MWVACKAGNAYYHSTPRQTCNRDFAAQLILLMCLPLGYTAYGGFMEAVHFVFIASLLAHTTLHDL